MKKTVLLLLGCSVASMSFGQLAQARLVFNNTGGTPYMVFNQYPNINAGFPNSGAYVVLDSKSPNAITTLPGLVATGNIRSEGAMNKIRWAISDSAGTYVVPYGTQGNVGMPLTLTKLAGGGTGSVVFATYNSYPYMAAQGWGGLAAAGSEHDNTQYMAAAGVTHMNDFSNGAVDNSDNAVNRFWIIDPNEANAALWTNYVTPPNVTLTFVHSNADIDVTPPADLLIPGAAPVGTVLRAQRFNAGIQKWADFMPAWVSWVGSPTVGTVVTTIGGANFMRAWTLSSFANPLPIELTSWSGACTGKEVKLTWTTASEHNNHYFTIEKSADEQTWSEIGRVEGADNSISSINYSFIDADASGLAYYRLSQVDNDGTSVTFSTITAGCDANSTAIVNAFDDGSDLNVVVSSTNEGVYDLYLTDAQGKVMVTRPSQTINNGYTTLKVNKASIAPGIYVVQLQNATNLMTRRAMIY